MGADVLYVCPECGREDTLIYDGKVGEVKCKCGWKGEETELVKEVVDYEDEG